MAASFDPYRDWLGIHEPSGKINYYQLFRLPVFESDPAAIQAAADATIARIKQIETSTLGEQRAKLLEKLAAAKRLLLDPARRAKYDATLVRPGAPTSTPLPRAIPIVKIVPIAPEDAAVSAPDSLAATDSTRSLWQESTAVPHRL